MSLTYGLSLHYSPSAPFDMAVRAVRMGAVPLSAYHLVRADTQRPNHSLCTVHWPRVGAVEKVPCLTVKTAS
jgi:hypothetical protein